MVSYQKFVSVVFETARQKGLDTSVQENNARTMSAAADVWNRRKDELSTATVTQARQIAQQEIQVR